MVLGSLFLAAKKLKPTAARPFLEENPNPNDCTLIGFPVCENNVLSRVLNSVAPNRNEGDGLQRFPIECSCYDIAAVLKPTANVFLCDLSECLFQGASQSTHRPGFDFAQKGFDLRNTFFNRIKVW